MQLSRMDGFLFNPKVSNTMAALDDPKSMFSVAARDALDSSGRTVMEYKRDAHGGRERLLEEFCTFVIWGFGVRAMKHVYDTALLHTPGLNKLGVELPDLDLALLPKNGKPDPKAVHQVLDGEWVGKFKKACPQVQQYKTLKKLLEKQSIQNKYRYSSIAKFGVASAVPALFIAFGIPTFNQWLTRKKLAKEKAAKAKSQSANGKVPNAQNSPLTANALRPTAFHTGMFAPRPMMGSARPQPFGVQPFASMPNPYANPFQTGSPANGAYPFSAPVPPVMAPANPWGYQFGGGSTASAHRPGAVRFGGNISHISDVASEILQHERWNTLFLDGTISSGRVYKARNNTERMEIAFRETTIIAFLYWIQRPVQDFISKLMGKKFKIPSGLEFKTIQHLAKEEKYHNNPELFKKELAEGLQALNWDKLKHAKDKEKQLVEHVYNYFLRHRGPVVNGKPTGTPNMVLEAAIDGGWIPTFHREEAGAQTLWQKLKSILHDINPIKEQQLTENQYLDLTKKIDTHAISSLVEHMQNLKPTALEGLSPLLKRVMRLRAGAWLFSNAFCFTFLSIIIPMLQHEITYKTTGKNYFPGVQQA